MEFTSFIDEVVKGLSKAVRSAPRNCEKDSGEGDFFENNYIHRGESRWRNSQKVA